MPFTALFSGLFAGLAVTVLVATGLVQGAQAERCPTMSTTDSPVAGSPPLDGFTVAHVPAGVGDPSDFEYEWEDVAFNSRVWESTTPDGSQVDLKVAVMRGGAFTDADALRAFLAGYHEQDPVTWARDPFTAGTRPGFRTDDRAFVLHEPGVALEVSLDRTRFGDTDLVETLCAVAADESSASKRAGHMGQPK